MQVIYSPETEIPTKRMEVYERMGLGRLEGSKLCTLLGFPSRTALNQQQIDSLCRLNNTYQKWKAKGHGLGAFLKYYSQKSRGEHHESQSIISTITTQRLTNFGSES